MEFVSSRKLFVVAVVIVMCFCWLMAYASMNSAVVVKFLPLMRQEGELTKPNSIPCVDRKASQYGRVEDIFCMNTCEMLPEFKNPCFYDYLEEGQKKLRCLPHFYILGVSKAGSTDIFRRLTLHSQVKPNRGIADKETSFWAWKRYGVYSSRPLTRNETTEFYLDMFNDTASQLEKNNSLNIITGDASPMDFFEFRKWPLIPQNKDRNEPLVVIPSLIKQFHNGHIPKFIITFREPIERAFSHYIFNGQGTTPLEFHDDVVKSLEIIETCIKENGKRYCFFSGKLHKNTKASNNVGAFSHYVHNGQGTTVLEFHRDVVKALTIIEMCIKENGKKYCFFSNKLHKSVKVTIQYSCYSLFLREWFKVFPRNVFFISRMEDRIQNLRETFIEMFQFLEIDPMSESQMLELTNKGAYNKGKRKAGKKVLPETVALLREFYQDCNAELAEMLNDDRYLWNDVYEYNV